MNERNATELRRLVQQETAEIDRLRSVNVRLWRRKEDGTFYDVFAKEIAYRLALINMHERALFREMA
jgi:hypothetical protein